MKKVEVTVENVVKAYKETGLKVMKSGWLDFASADITKCKACGLTTLYIHANDLTNEEGLENLSDLIFENSPIDLYERFFNIEWHFLLGFIAGFDYHDKDEYYGSNIDYCKGFRIGRESIMKVENI